jgi:hypothetical protein
VSRWVWTDLGWVNENHIVSAKPDFSGRYILHLTDGRTAETKASLQWQGDGFHHKVPPPDSDL